MDMTVKNGLILDHVVFCCVPMAIGQIFLFNKIIAGNDFAYSFNSAVISAISRAFLKRPPSPVTMATETESNGKVWTFSLSILADDETPLPVFHRIKRPDLAHQRRQPGGGLVSFRPFRVGQSARSHPRRYGRRIHPAGRTLLSANRILATSLDDFHCPGITLSLSAKGL